MGEGPVLISEKEALLKMEIVIAEYVSGVAGAIPEQFERDRIG